MHTLLAYYCNWH